jgi:hypothetical protein
MLAGRTLAVRAKMLPGCSCCWHKVGLVREEGPRSAHMSSGSKLGGCYCWPHKVAMAGQHRITSIMNEPSEVICCFILASGGQPREFSSVDRTSGHMLITHPCIV